MSVTNAMEGTISMKIYTILKGEHREVRMLFKTLQSMPGSEGDARETMMKKLCDELISHAKAEQEVVYPRVAERVSEQETQEAVREHEEIEQFIASLQKMEIGSDPWKDQLKMLSERVEHHVRKEEGKIFEQMKEKFSDDEAKEMAKRFHEVKNRELERLEKS